MKNITRHILALPFALLLSMPQNSAAQIGPSKTAPTSMKLTDYKSPAEIPVEAFFRNPEKSSFKISPDGKQIAFLAPVNDRMNIHVQMIGQTEVRKLTQVSDRDICSFYWGNDNIIVYLKDTGGDENYLLSILNVKTGLSQQITKQGSRVEVIDLLENDADNIIISSNMRNLEAFDLYKLNLSTLLMEMVMMNPGNVTSWILDHTGTPRLAISTNGVTTTLKHQMPGTKWEDVIETNFTESLSPLFFDFENKHVFCASNLDKDKSAIVLYDLERRKKIEEIYEHPEVDVVELQFSKKRKVLTYATYETDKLNREVFDDEMRDILDNIASKLSPAMSFQLIDNDKEETKFIVRTYSDVSLGAYYLYNTISQELTLLESLSPWLPEKLMCEMKPITYSNREGVIIHGYLTLPKNGTTQLPLVVNPHGGPWARDSWGFNPEVQFLASRGYAVLQMNFTGSTGYGKNFWQSSFKKWGQSMQNDITDGVNELISQRIADRKKVAIYGGSYGGYATLAGLSFTPDLYVCGIDYVGVSNLFTFLESIPPYWEPYRQMLYEMVGNPKLDFEMMKAYSPVFHADQIKAPLLIAQGAKDPRVNIKESDQMVEALSKRGVKVLYLVEPEEGHGFHNQENRFKFYRAMEGFLSQYLGGGKSEPAAGGK